MVETQEIMCVPIGCGGKWGLLNCCIKIRARNWLNSRAGGSLVESGIYTGRTPPPTREGPVTFPNEGPLALESASVLI